MVYVDHCAGPMFRRTQRGESEGWTGAWRGGQDGWDSSRATREDNRAFIHYTSMARDIAFPSLLSLRIDVSDRRTKAAVTPLYSALPRNSRNCLAHPLWLSLYLSLSTYLSLSVSLSLLQDALGDGSFISASDVELLLQHRPSNNEAATLPQIRCIIRTAWQSVSSAGSRVNRRVSYPRQTEREFRGRMPISSFAFFRFLFSLFSHNTAKSAEARVAARWLPRGTPGGFLHCLFSPALFSFGFTCGPVQTPTDSLARIYFMCSLHKRATSSETGEAFASIPLEYLRLSPGLVTIEQNWWTVSRISSERWI